MLPPGEIQRNLETVREQITSSASRAGRDPGSVRIIAVTKTFPPETVRAAYDCGLREFGENRVQEFLQKLPHLNLPGAVFHLIGHLQSNKVSHALGFSWIQTIDSERLARRLNEAAGAAGKHAAVLIQVRFDDPAAAGPERGGLPESDVPALAGCLATLPHLELRGLMTLPPYTEDAQQARSFFRRLRELRDRLQSAGHTQVRELSMGMTRDFPIAIEEGATMVRLGTALFGPRTAPARAGFSG